MFWKKLHLFLLIGKPYDTLEEVIGKRINSQTGTFRGSLKDWGIKYLEMDCLYKVCEYECKLESYIYIWYDNIYYEWQWNLLWCWS